MTPPGPSWSLGPLAWYYLATPVFFLTDVLWGINVRIMALDHLPVRSGASRPRADG